MIVVGGMIGTGKTTTTKMLEEELSLPSFFETVKGNEILPLFYKATPEEKEKNVILFFFNYLSCVLDFIPFVKL